MGRHRKLQGKRALVTGASSGIGRALAVELAAAGARLFLAARSPGPLEQLEQELRQAGHEAHACAVDLTVPTDRQRMLDTAQERLGGLDLLVNNAGVGASGPFRSGSEPVLRQIMELNFFALAETIRSALPLLERGDQPMIVNISSVLGRRAIPDCSEYCASKFAVTGFSESLRAELARSGIDVMVVHAGLTKTDFRAHMVQRGPRREWQKHRGMPARTVARKVVRAMRRGKHELDLTFEGWMLIRLNKLFPRVLDWAMARF